VVEAKAGLHTGQRGRRRHKRQGGQVEGGRLLRRTRDRLAATPAVAGPAAARFGETAFDSGDGCRLRGRRLDGGDSPMLLVGVDGPQLVRLHGDGADVLVVVFTQPDTQEAGKALKEEEQEEWASLMHSGAQLQHLLKQLGGLPPTQGLHGMDLLHTLKLTEIVVLTKSLLDSLVRVLLRWVGHKVQDGPQALLGQGVDDQVKLHLLVFDVTEAKPRLGDAEPRLRVLRLKKRKAERASMVVVRKLLVVVHCRGSPIVALYTRMK
jgi:hypothetical protein